MMVNSPNSFSEVLSELCVKVHFAAYRVSCDIIERISVFTLNSVFRPDNRFKTLPEAFSAFRRFSVIDFTYVAAMNAANKTIRIATNKKLIKESDLKTWNEQKNEKEILQLREHFGEKSIQSRFSKQTALLIADIIPKEFGEQLARLPPSLENYILYHAGLVIRYLNHKLDRYTKYRDIFIRSETKRYLERIFCGIRTRTAKSILSPRTLNPFLNTESILLKLFLKIEKDSSQESRRPFFGNVFIQSLARSFKRMQDADKFVDEQIHKLHLTEAEAYIARLEWYSNHHILPKGLPNTQLISLNTDNLQKELNHSQKIYLDDIAKLIVEETFSGIIKSKLMYSFYLLEGKDALSCLISTFLRQYVVEQLSEPHLFTQSFLFASGIDASDFDSEGYGRGKLDGIFSIGQRMLQTVLEGNGTFSDVLAIYERSKLRYKPGGIEEILQKREAKCELKKLIFRYIYTFIKPEPYRHEGLFKEFRETLSDLPVIGLATTILHLFFNGMIYSIWHFIYRDEDIRIAIFRDLSGKRLCNTLTEKTIELIYHPGIRFIILDLMESIKEFVTNKEKFLIVDESETIEDLKSVAHFLFHHFLRDTRLPVKTLFNSIAHRDTLFELKNSIKPPGKSFPLLLAESVLPTLKEVHLSYRVLQIFRKRCITFEGDQKFWELFVREFIHRLVRLKVLEFHPLERDISVSKAAEIREELIDFLLETNDTQIQILLSKEPTLEPFKMKDMIRSCHIDSELFN